MRDDRTFEQLSRAEQQERRIENLRSALWWIERGEGEDDSGTRQTYTREDMMQQADEGLTFDDDTIDRIGGHEGAGSSVVDAASELAFRSPCVEASPVQSCVFDALFCVIDAMDFIRFVDGEHADAARRALELLVSAREKLNAVESGLAHGIWMRRESARAGEIAQ